MCEGAMADWSGVYFQKVVNTPSSMMTIGYLAFTSTMATGRFLGDGLVRRLGVVKMLQLSGSLIAGGLMISIIFPFLVPATIGFLFVGFGVSSVVPIVYGLAGRSTTMPTSVALAAVSTIGFLGFLLGPPVIGFIAEAFSLRVSFAVVAALGVVSILMARKAR
jgi:MFS family permease